MRQANNRNRKNLYEFAQFLVMLFLSCATLLAALLTAALLAVGLYEIAMSVLVFFGNTPMPQHTSSPIGGTMELAIKGIEILLLAPLGYFVTVTVAHYAKDSATGGPDRKAKADLITVKALSIGLLIAVVAADLVGKVLSQEGLTYEAAICECLVIVVLGLYYFGLEIVAGEESGHPFFRGNPTSNGKVNETNTIDENKQKRNAHSL